MSEFKFACPVCGQHITADSSNSGGQIECPTCFQKIVVPQAPSSPDSKFILSATQVGKPRPVSSSPDTSYLTRGRPGTSWVTVTGLVVVLAALGAAGFVFRERLFHGSSTANTPTTTTTSTHTVVLHDVKPMPTNTAWTLVLTNATIPGETAVGGIRSEGFACEKATLTGGNLSLRQGATWPPDLGVTVSLFAQQGEDLAGKSLEVAPERPPPLPRVTLRWKDDQGRAQSRNFNSGYALKVSFGPAINGRIEGKIFLALPDEEKSFVAGTFDAEIRRPPPPRPRTR